MKRRKVIAITVMALSVTSFVMAQEDTHGSELENRLRGMFETDTNAESDLLIQLTKDTSRTMMLTLLAELQFLTQSKTCRSVNDAIYGADRGESLGLAGYTQVYDADYLEYASGSPVVRRMIMESETWNERETFLHCAYQLGKVRGSISALENAYYNPLLNLQTGERSAELNAAIAEEIMLGLERGY